MKILFWMSGSFDRRTPSEHLLAAMIRALCRQGHEVHIIERDTGGDLPKLPESLQGLPVTCDAVPSRPAAKGNFVARYLVDLKYVRDCRKIIRKYRDCEAAFHQSSNVAGFMVHTARRLLPRARITYNVQDIFPENAAYTGSAGGIVYKVLSAEQRYAYRHADQLITVSQDMRDLLVEKGADPARLEVIYNWSYQDEPYDPASLENETIRAMLPKDKYNVVYAGNIGVMQNVDVVIEAARLMNDDSVHFHVIGDGVYKDKLIEKAKDLPNISFWPMQPSALAPSIYAMADINVIPLAEHIYRTALPSKTATCLACQRPIIFAFGSESKFGQWMQSEAGCAVVESKDANSLCEAIRRIRQAPPDNRLAEIFRKDFSITANSERYAALIAKGK